MDFKDFDLSRQFLELGLVAEPIKKPLEGSYEQEVEGKPIGQGKENHIKRKKNYIYIIIHMMDLFSELEFQAFLTGCAASFPWILKVVVKP